MKTCPYCQAANRDDAAFCYACGRDLANLDPDPVPPSRTQPVRTRPDSTQPLHFPPPANPQPAPPSQYQQPDYGNAYVYPNNTASNQAYPPQQPGYQPGYPPYGQPAYPPSGANMPPPPAPPPDPSAASSPFLPWPVMIGTVVLLILCVCGLASWGISSTAFGGAGRFGQQISTQVANVFTGSESSATPSEPPSTPTPWPTLTPAPTETPLPTSTPLPTNTPAPEPTQTNNPTQQANQDKLLSPQCKTALDTIQQVSGEATKNPASLLDGQWRDAFGNALDAMKTSCGTLDAASPVPGEIADVRHNLDTASQSFDQAKQLFNEGVDQRDPGKLLQAGQEMQKALDSLGKAIDGLRKIGQ